MDESADEKTLLLPRDPDSHVVLLDNMLDQMEYLDSTTSRLEDSVGLVHHHLGQLRHAMGSHVPADWHPSPKLWLDWINGLLSYQWLLVIGAMTIIVGLVSLIQVFQLSFCYQVLIYVISVCMEALSIGILVLCVVQIYKKLVSNQPNNWFLARTYVCTVIAFAGLYLLAFQASSTAFEMESMDRLVDLPVYGQFFKFLYLSTTSSTLCGSANVQPRAFYASLLVNTQCILSFLFFAAIISGNICNFSTYNIAVHRPNQLQQSRPISTA